MILNCLITGVGGQGTVLVSRLIGDAAIAKGLDVRGSETIGMAQRGGCVVSHIRIGENIHSPLIPPAKANIIIAFEPAEAVRVISFLAPGGRMIVLDRGVMPVSSALGKTPYKPAEMLVFLKAEFARPKEDQVAQADDEERLIIISGDELIKKCGDPKVLNTALLGIALEKKFFPFTAADILEVLKKRIPAKYLEMNVKALGLGKV
jgi:indolepyruvate ferredoxin oxidoreductase beta subunit